MTRIAIDCLNCGHCGSMSPDRLLEFGLEPGAPIAAFVHRLARRECGGKSVRAFRYEADDADEYVC